MEKKVFKVGISTDGTPAVLPCFANLPRGGCQRPGYIPDVFHLVMRVLDWDYEFVYDPKPGDVYNETHGVYCICIYVQEFYKSWLYS